MYVIGTTPYDCVAITTTTKIYGCDVWAEIVRVEHEVPLHDSTLFASREAAIKALLDIRDRVDEIQFQNYSILGEIIDKNGFFDKEEFVKTLKIYELVPMEISEF